MTKEEILSLIDETITENNAGAITAAKLNNALKSIVEMTPIEVELYPIDETIICPVSQVPENLQVYLSLAQSYYEHDTEVFEMPIKSVFAKDIGRVCPLLGCSNEGYLVVNGYTINMDENVNRYSLAISETPTIRATFEDDYGFIPSSSPEITSFSGAVFGIAYDEVDEPLFYMAMVEK